MMVEEGFVKTLKFDSYVQFCFAKELLNLIDVRRVFDETDYENEYNREKMSKGYYVTREEEQEITIKNLSEEEVQSFTGLADVITLLKDFKVKFSDSYGRDADDIIKKWNKEEAEKEVNDF